MDVALKKERTLKNRFNPKKFGLWIALGSISMMFFALTSAYMVRQAAGNWLEFSLPDIFVTSTVILVVSSFILEGSLWAYKKEKPGIYRGLLIFTFVLGLAFLLSQVTGWNQLELMGVELTGNPAGSFVYVISGLHAAHILGGLAALTVALIHAFGLPYYYSEGRRSRFTLIIQYWHFMGILWIYLFLFFTFFR
jgi:cytochrome c oxidase subunit 3